MFVGVPGVSACELVQTECVTVSVLHMNKYTLTVLYCTDPTRLLKKRTVLLIL